MSRFSLVAAFLCILPAVSPAARAQTSAPASGDDSAELAKKLSNPSFFDKSWRPSEIELVE